MSRPIFTTILGKNVTQEQLEACAELFTKNYGVWGEKAQETNKYLKNGLSSLFYLNLPLLNTFVR